MVDPVHCTRALSRERRNDERGGGAQIGRHDRRARELRNALNDGRMAFDRDVGAHAAELRHVHEAVLEDSLSDVGGPFGKAVERHELRLHVGGKAGMRHRADGNGLRTARHAHAHPVGADVEHGARGAELVEHHLHLGGLAVGHQHVALRHHACDEEGSGFNAVGDDRVLGAVQALDALDANHRRARAGDVRSHGVEAVAQIDHLGLAGGIFDHRLALGEHGGHHQILRAGHRDHVGHDVRALEALRRRTNISVVDVHSRAKLAQAADVLVHGAGADGAAARQAHLGASEARGKRAERQHGGAHRLHELVRSLRARHVACIERHVRARPRHLDAHALEELEHRAHVGQVRHVVKHQIIRREQRRRKDGKCGVLGAGRADFAHEAVASVDSELLHDFGISLVCRGVCLHSLRGPDL